MPLLEVRDLTKRFGGVLAVDSVNLDVDEGQIFGLIGANGAGKTTLFNLITGFEFASAGRVILGGRDLTSRSISDRVRFGVARTFQTPQLFGQMSVRENILSGTFASQLAFTRSGKARFRSPGDIQKRYEWTLDLLGLERMESIPAADMPYSMQRKLEIARALMTNPRLLMLDEPAAGMLPQEADELNMIIRNVRIHGCTVVVVEHNMRVVMNISDHVAVMEFGKVIARGTPTEVRASPDVIRAYLGETT